MVELGTRRPDGGSIAGNIYRVPRVFRFLCVGAVASLLQLSWFRRVITIVLPAAAPAIVAGLRISFGSALVAVVPAEMLLGELGVGYLSWIEWNNLDISGVMFAILVVGIVGVILDAGLNRLAQLVTYVE